MKIFIVFTLFNFLLLFQITAQNNFVSGVNITSGYTINKVVENELFMLQPELANTFPVELGFFSQWNPSKRFAINLKSNIAFNNVKLSYNDLETFEKVFANSDTLVFANSFLLHESYSVFSYKIPVSLYFYVVDKFYVMGGAGLRFNFHKKIENSNEILLNFGIGSTRKKIGWSVFIEESLSPKGYIINENVITKQHPNVNVASLSRSIKFSIAYNLW